jgi:hypothetical protein
MLPRSPADLLKELPRKVQRRLAEKGYYPDFFARQDNQLALTTFRFLGPKSLTHILKRHDDFNPHLLHQICNAKVYCGNSSVKLEILSHPACPASFAENAWSVSRREVNLLYLNKHRLCEKVQWIVNKRLH